MSGMTPEDLLAELARRGSPSSPLETACGSGRPLGPSRLTCGPPSPCTRTPCWHWWLLRRAASGVTLLSCPFPMATATGAAATLAPPLPVESSGTGR